MSVIVSSEHNRDPGAELKGAASLRFGGFEVGASGPPELWEELEAYLGPQLEVVPGLKSGLGMVLSATFSRQRTEALASRFGRESSREVRLHGDACGLAIGTPRDELLVWKVGERSAYLVRGREPRTLEAVYEACSATARLDFARLVRGVLSRGAEQQGAIRIHGACVAMAQGGVLLVGPSGAGKTSFMLSVLQGRSGASLVANDKALLCRNSAGVRVLGIPYAVSIGPGALARCPGIRDCGDGRIINGETYLWPCQVARGLDCDLQASVPLKAVLRVQLSLDQERHTLAAAGIETMIGAVADFTEAMHPHWLDTALGIEPGRACRASDFAGVSCWTLSANPWTAPMAEVLRDVIAAG